MIIVCCFATVYCLKGHAALNFLGWYVSADYCICTCCLWFSYVYNLSLWDLVIGSFCTCICFGGRSHFPPLIINPSNRGPPQLTQHGYIACTLQCGSISGCSPPNTHYVGLTDLQSASLLINRDGPGASSRSGKHAISPDRTSNLKVLRIQSQLGKLPTRSTLFPQLPSMQDACSSSWMGYCFICSWPWRCESGTLHVREFVEGCRSNWRIVRQHGHPSCSSFQWVVIGNVL